MNPPPLYGLILSGGRSSRMHQDKGSLVYDFIDARQNRKSQRAHCYDILKPFCEEVFISCRKEQKKLVDPTLRLIFDANDSESGPGAGLVSAFNTGRNCAWLILACDFPFVDEEIVRFLIAQRDPTKFATLFRNSETNILEPLFAIWEPSALEVFYYEYTLGYQSPRKCLESLHCKIMNTSKSSTLKNVNTEAEWKILQQLKNASASENSI